MQLHNIKPNTPKKSQKRVGRGGKRGTFSGHGTKGQKGRAGASVEPGFRGGDNRLWQLFPKQRGATQKHGGAGNSRPHKKHRFFRLKNTTPTVLNLGDLNMIQSGQAVDHKFLIKEGYVQEGTKNVKILSDGKFDKKLEFEGLKFSESAKEKVLKAG